MANTISILGCGYVGKVLAETLSTTHDVLKVSTRSTDLDLADVVQRFHILVESDSITGDLSFFDCDTLVVLFPFSRSLEDPTLYLEQHRLIIRHLISFPVKKVIFVSSTSYYATEGTFVETDLHDPSSKRSKVLHQVEQLYLAQETFSTVVLRFGGIFGPGRGMDSRLIRQSPILNADHTVNIVHVNDCVESIIQSMKQIDETNIFNVVGDCHESRRHIYTELGKRAGVQPIFPAESPLKIKIVSNQKIKDMLSLSFNYSNPI